ncbi:uncharacterized protein LOC135478040 [Liolophura sinensis]|uniref:uncharacterized protein LOC135478040 n=1 Tax=Liolophura sinensis TaxID=3198878 RepID=UPI00315839C6
MKLLLFTAVVFSLYVGTPAPLHASCKVTWTFHTDCASVNKKIVDQMTAWKSADNCANGGEKCLYTIVSHDATTIKGKHTTPVKHYIDDLTFTFIPEDSNCRVQGYSTSETWYAVLDHSTNYCNLNNLITGSGLHQSSGYTETTNDSACTQYSSANCEKY